MDLTLPLFLLMTSQIGMVACLCALAAAAVAAVATGQPMWLLAGPALGCALWLAFGLPKYDSDVKNIASQGRMTKQFS